MNPMMKMDAKKKALEELMAFLDKEEGSVLKPKEAEVEITSISKPEEGEEEEMEMVEMDPMSEEGSSDEELNDEDLKALIASYMKRKM